jgi:hypothetical protein
LVQPCSQRVKTFAPLSIIKEYGRCIHTRGHRRISPCLGSKGIVWSDTWKVKSKSTNSVGPDPKIHHRVYKSPQPVTILSQLTALHTPQPVSPRSILIQSSSLCLFFQSGIFLSGFPTKTLYIFLLVPCVVSELHSLLSTNTFVSR